MFTIGDVNYLDINTNNSTINDTELGLYDAGGLFLVTDDDDGIGLKSTLTFNDGGNLLLGDSYNLNNGYTDGRDGPLGPGTYYLAIGVYNTTFGATFDDVTSTGTDGAYQIDFYMTAVPAPSALALLGLAGLARRRRR